MINILKNVGIVSLIVSVWAIFSNFINNLFIWEYLTSFFVFMRMLFKPVEFLWNFDTSIEIITLILGILVAYSSFQAVMIIRNNFKNN